MKIKKKSPLTKELLLQAIHTTHDDAKLFVGIGVEDDCDFTEKLCLNRSNFCTKTELLELVQNNATEQIGTVPGFPDYLTLGTRIYVSKGSIDDNRIFQTNTTDGYFHAICKYNPHYDVYIKLDQEAKTISFLLGPYEKTLQLIEYTGFVHKPVRQQMHCQTARDLEVLIHDEFWNPAMITVGRHILKIPSLF